MAPSKAPSSPSSSVNRPSTTGQCTQHHVASSVEAFLRTTARRLVSPRQRKASLVVATCCTNVSASLLQGTPANSHFPVLEKARPLTRVAASKGAWLPPPTVANKRESHGDSHSSDDWHGLRNSVAHNFLLLPVQATINRSIHAWL